jgi:oxygen-independent coproporphyrinogen-3 oxidase
MAGIYIHIPFCKQACHYCNFHFSTHLSHKNDLVAALVREATLQKSYLRDEVTSIYYGGGTPSLLEVSELERITASIKDNFQTSQIDEFTVEVNPDDVTTSKMDGYKKLGIDRLSMGVQSFHDKDLEFMNRAHTAKEATASIDIARKAGFEDMTIDLIYGTPTLDDKAWEENLQRTIDLGLPHISAYALTVEPGTALAHFVDKGQVPQVEDARSAAHFEMAMEILEDAGYVHYEISNFALPGREAVHNSKYWTGEHYLGLGPGAHSYNGLSRQWNVASNKKYIDAVTEEGKVPFELEELTEVNQFNEYLLTRLRTRYGVLVDEVGEPFRAGLREALSEKAALDEVMEDGGRYRLTRKGKLIADQVVADMLADEVES